MSVTRDERADAYLHGLLSPREVREFERELTEDPALQRALDVARRRLALLESALPPAEASELLVRATLHRVDRQVRQRRRWRKAAYAFLAAPVAAGVLIVALFQTHYRNLAANPANLEVYGQRDLLPGSQGAIRVRLTDHRTRVPLVGVPVEVSLGEPGSAQFVSLASFTTDDHGNGQPSFQLPDWADGTYPLRVTAKIPDQPEVVTQPVALRRAVRVLLSTDKPRYQPGQTIHLRVLALRRPDLQPVADSEAAFTITDPKGNVIFRRVERTSSFGIAAVDCPLATELIEGPYRVQAQVANTDSTQVVEVTKYVLPRVRVTVTTDQPWYQPGQEVQATIQADYFHGEPTADADWVLEASSTRTRPPLIARLNGRTDATGKAAVRFRLLDNWEGEVALAVEVTDRAGQKQSAAQRRPVARQPFRVVAVPENGQLVPGVPNSIFVFASAPDGSPVQVRGTYRIDEGPQPIETGELGLASFTMTPNRDAFAVMFDLTDAAGRRVAVPLTLAVGAASEYLLRLDRAVYTSGQTINVTLVGSGNDPVFLDLLKDDQTVRSEVIDMANGQGSLALDLPADLFGTLQLVTYRFDGAGKPVRKSRTVFVRAARELTIGVKLDRPEYRPGERARLSFSLADEKGNPVAGALSLAAVDEAVFDVRQQLPGLERTFYLLEQKLLQPTATIYPWSPDQRPGGDPRQQALLEQAVFAPTTQVDTPGRASSAPTHTLVADTYPAKARETARERDHGLSLVRVGWGLLVLWGLLAIYVLLWMNLRLVYMIVLHAVLLVGACAILSIALIGAVAPESFKASRRFDSVGAAMEAPAAMAPGARAPAPGGAEAAAQPTIRVRERFPETLLWRPQLITDVNGQATLDLELADSITTWRLAAGAVARDGRLGALQRGIRVFQPFFVDLNLPVALTRGDEVEVPVVVSSYLPDPQTVEVTLADADWFERIGERVARLELKPREVRSVSFRIRARRVGRFELQVSATGGGIGDALKRAIEIVPEGRRVEQATNGALKGTAAVTLDLPQEAVEGSGRAIVRIYPSGFSQVVEGLDSLFQLPTGCFEQTSSALYPNVMALEYLRSINRRVPEIEAKAQQYIHVGAQRLLTFEVHGGGFDWYGRPPANVTLTAYGLMEFRDLARVYPVDPNLIARTRRWLMAQRTGDGSWAASRPGMEQVDATGRLRTTAYVAWSVFEGDPTPEANATRAFLLRHPPESIKSAYDLALVCLALHAIDPKDEALKPYLTQLISSRQGNDAEQVWWPMGAGHSGVFYSLGRTADIETTALAILAMIRTDRFPPLVRSGLNWIVAQRGVGHWGSTQATILALKALLAGTGKPEPGPRRVEVALGGRVLGTIEAPPDQAEVMQQFDVSPHLTPGKQELTLQDLAGNMPGFQVEFRYHVPGEAKAEDAGPLGIDVKYDRETLAPTEVLRATATVVNRGPLDAPMVMLDLPIPPGFRVDPEPLDELVQAGTIGRYDITPRQIIVYLRQLGAGRSLAIEYRMTPGATATLTVPAARAWEYYNPDRAARGRPTRLTIR